MAAAEALASFGDASAVKAWDEAFTPSVRAAARALRRRGIAVALGGDGASALDPSVCSVVKAPGVPADAPILRGAAARGLQAVDEFELGWRLSSRPIIAITGTNGKSTTAALIVEALAATGTRPPLAGNTNFGPPLSAVPRIGGSPVVAEVSSYQLEYCPSFLPEVAVLTNVTEEHLWRHRTMAAYAALKRRLFVRDELASPLAVLNLDDATGFELAGQVRDRGGVAVTYGWGADADYRIAHASWTLERGNMTLATPDGSVELSTRHPGHHNAANVAAAFAVADSLGLERGASIPAIERAPRVPGRLESLDEGQRFHAIVDFAHTRDGVTQTIKAIRAAVDGRIITVFGAVGSAEDPMRRATGRAARALSDVLILTTGNLRGEPRMLPLQGLRAGATELSRGTMCVELDRRRAIAKAIELAEPGDAVVVLGRGPLARMVTGRSGSSFPFDDRQVMRELLREST
ncbi:MAG: hypothetical protein JOZ73_01685 [Solirubrobacterales bacterium]|nr:hypothetical protein [Solirubrobacterales bacterium]